VTGGKIKWRDVIDEGNRFAQATGALGAGAGTLIGTVGGPPGMAAGATIGGGAGAGAGWLLGAGRSIDNQTKGPLEKEKGKGRFHIF